MSVLQGTVVINGITYAVLVTAPTVRIPELSPVVLPYDDEDKLALYDYDENKTVYTRLEDFRQYVLLGTGGTPIPPILQGNTVEIIITAEQAAASQLAAASATTYPIVVSELAGKIFALERRSVGLLKTSEYSILPSGGFQLPAGNAVFEDEVFFAQIFTYADPESAPTATAGSSLNGMATLSADIQLSSIHFNKLLHIAAGALSINVSLPDITSVPEGLVMPFETTLGNTKQSKVIAIGGQQIYFGNRAVNEIIVGINEYLSVMRHVDGWYVVSASESILNVGRPSMDYVVRINTVAATGQLVPRADYPRAWEWLSENASILVTDTVWNSSILLDSEYFQHQKGKFSSGDGSTTFRFPDLRNQVFRSLLNIGGADTERPDNTAGTLQKDQMKQHSHDISTTDSGSSQSAGRSFGRANTCLLRGNPK